MSIACTVSSSWKPWVGNRSNAWGGMEDPPADHLIQQWNEYARALMESGDELPDSFHRDMRLAAREVARPAQIEEGGSKINELEEDPTLDEWMCIARSVFANESDASGDVYSNIVADESHRCPCVSDIDDQILAQYAFGNINDIKSALVSARATNSDLRREMPPIYRDQLNDEQRLAHDAYVDGPPGIHLLLGEAGTGKSVVISAIKTTLAQRGHKCLITATTGKAASIIGGSTCLDQMG